MKTFPFLTAALIGLILFCNALANEYRVAIINSYHPDFNWVRMHNGVLRRGLTGQADVSQYYLDFKRSTPQQSAANGFPGSPNKEALFLF
ncbi:hypothetical protein [Desulfovibrio sp. JC022]|uniref:hypothetical protein n=1 Tax=Desulfovibrio sp. JC022 TaxID=2593642 RepID=UPI0013D3DFF8|nr:hypothetical protein [Desulfovibrio sp. JC022]NDV21313.1 hypothetical protein [Desulfovibrio sp. JC022]